MRRGAVSERRYWLIVARNEATGEVKYFLSNAPSDAELSTLLRHMVLCLVVRGFVAEQTDRLRGGKPGGDAGAGVPGVEPALPELAGGAAGDDGAGVDGGDHRLPPEAQPRRPPVAAKAEAA